MPHSIPPSRCLVILFAFAAALVARAGGDALAAVVRADDERVAAILAADPARLDAIFSDDLQYTHSNGKLDSKKSYVEALVSHKTVYQKYEYLKRDFSLASADIALMRAHVLIQSVNNGAAVTNDLSALAVFRHEGGHWRFLAWQSAKLPPPAAAPAAK